MKDRCCKLLAVDLDGTLVNRGKVAPEDAGALRDAAKAGILVCLCTGRSWAETRPVWEHLNLPGPQAPVICVGGAVVTEPATGRSLYSRTFERPVAGELIAAMGQMGYPVMALVDAWREGFDYYMVGAWDGHGMYRRFFNGQRAKIRDVAALDESCAAPIRISVLEEPAKAPAIVERLREQFAGRIEIHDIFAPNYGVYIVESFSARTSKFTALTYVGQGYRIGPGSMAAIGDDNNDLPMLKGAAFSAAPDDAPPQVKAAAKTIVAGRGQGGVAQFVRQLLC